MKRPLVVYGIWPDIVRAVAVEAAFSPCVGYATIEEIVAGHGVGEFS
jgi:hypothetical protein